jgi:3-hydroxyisobutyrate dehydrogenase-like beta-hydroxyacid dehydrogenase
MKVAFLGLGMMGSPMARRLIQSGREVSVWNRSPEKSEPFSGDAKVATSPEAASSGAEVVFTMLADPDALRDVVLGDDGVLQGMASGSTLIEMSTVGPAPIREIANHLHTGMEMLDSPVLGSVPQATDGSLQLFVGGSDEGYGKHEELLTTFGTPKHIGPLGSGAAMKLVANSVLGVLMTGLGEAISLGLAMGLEEEAILDVLSDSPIGKTASSKRDKIASGVYDSNFRLGLAVKDLKLVCSMAEHKNVDLKLGRAARSWFQVAEENGSSDLDYSAVVAAILDREATA